MLLTRTVTGTAPLSTADARSFLKQDSTADDTRIAGMILAATEYAEGFVGRDVRANTYELLLDAFEARIALPRTPVASITSVSNLVSGSWVAADAASFYLKNGPWCAEVILKAGYDWPTDTDDLEHAVRVIFVTAACAQTSVIVEGIQRHVAALYQDRGDVGTVSLNAGPDGQTRYVVAELAKLSGAEAIYAPFTIPRL